MYCECGCGQRTSIATKTDTAQGRVKGQPNRFVNGHNARRGAEDYVIDDNGCWVWQRTKSWGGYGLMSRDGEKSAHRWYYIQHIGPIPEGMDLDHLCRNRACVNPDHLEPVTRTVNAHRGTKTVLTADDVRAIDAAFVASGLPLRQFARAYAGRWNVSQDYLRDVVKRRRGVWASVPQVRHSPLSEPYIVTPEVRERFIAFMETQGYPRDIWTISED